jgi:hypothetical protein
MGSPSNSQVILCTGANRFLGLLPSVERLHPATHILGSRPLEAGHVAVNELQKQCSKAEIKIETLELDVADDRSFAPFKFHQHLIRSSDP